MTRVAQPTRRQFLVAGLGVAASTLTSFGQGRDLATLTVKEASELIRRRQISPVELIEDCLQRIDQYNPPLNAFVTVAREQALQAARQLEGEQRHGTLRGPLHGVPVAFKDNIDTAGIRTTGASALFKDRIPDEDAHVVSRLNARRRDCLGQAESPRVRARRH